MLVLRLRTICYIELVLVFSTGQDIIVNSHCPRSQHLQRSVCLMSVSKSATAKWYCLRELKNKLSEKSNQVLATEYSGYLLVYIGKI
jgi:hypothetical protein